MISSRGRASDEETNSRVTAVKHRCTKCASDITWWHSEGGVVLEAPGEARRWSSVAAWSDEPFSWFTFVGRHRVEVKRQDRFRSDVVGVECEFDGTFTSGSAATPSKPSAAE
jgi:hypothetical protein